MPFFREAKIEISNFSSFISKKAEIYLFAGSASAQQAGEGFIRTKGYKAVNELACSAIGAVTTTCISIAKHVIGHAASISSARGGMYGLTINVSASRKTMDVVYVYERRGLANERNAATKKGETVIAVFVAVCKGIRAAPENLA